MIGGETTIDDLRRRIAKIEQEQDVLAAHVERCNQFLEDMHIMDTDWTIQESVNIKGASSATSLARRDLLKQAEALDVAAAVITGGMLTGEKAVSYLERVADDLRQQANHLEKKSMNHTRVYWHWHDTACAHKRLQSELRAWLE